MTDNQLDPSVFIAETKRKLKSGNNVVKHFSNARDALRREVDVVVDARFARIVLEIVKSL